MPTVNLGNVIGPVGPAGPQGPGSGDFMADGSVAMTGDLHAGGHKVTNLAAPTADSDAARKSDVASAASAAAAAQTTANAAIPAAQKGAPSGVATLGTDGKVPAGQLPAMDYVPTTRTVNNKPLSADIALSAADVGAVPTARTVNGKALSADIALSAADVGARGSDWTPAAGEVSMADTSGGANVEAAIASLKASVSSGKAAVAAAVTDKGVTTAADASFSTMAANIRAISTGTDTSDATAAAGDILSGKTAYANGAKLTGTIPSKSSGNLSSSGLTVTVPAGYYPSAASKTCSDGNLIASNIRNGVTLFGVTGTLSGLPGYTVVADYSASASAYRVQLDTSYLTVGYLILIRGTTTGLILCSTLVSDSNSSAVLWALSYSDKITLTSGGLLECSASSNGGSIVPFTTFGVDTIQIIRYT